MANKGTVRIEGAAELSAMLNAIPQELRKDIITTAVRSAASPLVKAAKAMAVTSVDTGALRKSIGFVVRKYKSGVNAVAVVGPRRGTTATEGSSGPRPAEKAQTPRRSMRTSLSTATCRGTVLSWRGAPSCGRLSRSLVRRSRTL